VREHSGAIAARVESAQITEYQTHGVTCVRGVFSRAEMNELLQACRDAVSRAGPRLQSFSAPGESGRVFRDEFMSRVDPIILSICLSPAIGEISARLCGSRAMRFFSDHLFIKEAHASMATPWHQDLPYYPLRGTQLPGVWIAITACSRASSALQYVAGSHRWQKFLRANLPGVDPASIGSERCADFSDARHQSDQSILGFDLEPGDIVVHDPLTVHGAGGNPTDHSRYALSVRLAGENVTWDPRPHTLKVPSFPTPSFGEPVEGELFPIVWSEPH
jgi:ectoine hydroxylase-related dioxygenase (phytanoyl-CoA dioxygenase family)